MKRHLTVLVLIASSFFGNAMAQSPSGTSPKTNPNVTEFEVNGLKVLVKRRPGAPTVSAAIYIRGGVNNYSAQDAGIEELALQAMADGSVKFPRAAMRRELSRMGSSVAGSSSYDFGVMAMASTNENFDRTWELFSEAALRPAFDNQTIETSRERILTGLRTQSTSPDGNLDFLSSRVTYRNHPYAKTPFGNIDSINRFKEKDLRAYHEKVMATSQLLLIIVGDVDLNDIRKKAGDSFGKLARGSYEKRAVPGLNFEKPSVEVVPRSVETTYVKGVFAAPSLASPDYYAMRVAVSFLQMLVYQEVRTARNLSYAPNAEMDNLLANSAHIYVTAIDVNQAVAVMLDQIERLKAAPLEEERLTGIPNFFLTTYYIDNETNAAQNGELAKYELLGRGWRDAENFISNISSVTPNDIQRVARRYMRNIQFVVVGNPQPFIREVFLRQ
jgi:zinc protease